jgi:hypothetical protein
MNIWGFGVSTFFKRTSIQEWGLHAGPKGTAESKTSSETTDVERSLSRLMLIYS